LPSRRPPLPPGGVGRDPDRHCRVHALGFALGTPLAVGQVYGHPWLRRLVGIYAWFFRESRCLFFCFSFTSASARRWTSIFQPSPWPSSFGPHQFAYQSQIFRGAICHFRRGSQGARALGMSDSRRSSYYPAPGPQAFHPRLVQRVFILLRTRRWTYALGCGRNYGRAHFVATRTYQQLPLYVAAGVIFLSSLDRNEGAAPAGREGQYLRILDALIGRHL